MAKLFHSVQAEHGDRQNSILTFGRNAAKNTYILAAQTKDDSFAMKTVAIVMMFFLLGTAFSVGQTSKILIKVAYSH